MVTHGSRPGLSAVFVGVCSMVLLSLAGPNATSAREFGYHVDMRPATVVDATGATGAGDPDARLNAAFQVDIEAGTFCPSFGGLVGLSTPTAVHVHAGVAGTNGPIVAEFDVPVAEGGFGDCVDVSPDVIEAIVADPLAFYMDLHTDEFPDGAVRGQMRLTGICTLDGWAPGQDEGTSDTQLYEGEELYVMGRFFEGAVLTVTIAYDGAVESTEVFEIGVDPYLLEMTIPFAAGDAGSWIVTAVEPTIGDCDGTVAINVIAGPRPSAGPGPSAGTPPCRTPRCPHRPHPRLARYWC